MVEIFDIDKIKEKVKQVSDHLKNQESERQKIREKIRELQEEERRFDSKLKDDVHKEFAELEKQFTFIGDVRQKFDALAQAFSRASKTQEDVVILYGKAFRRLSNDRINIPKEVYDMTNDFGDQYTLTLYSKGFGSAYGTGSSQFINDWIILKKIFGNPDIANYITKSDKLSMFHAFADAVSNWVDIDKKETESIEINKSVPYIKVKENYNLNRIDIENITATQIKITRDYYGEYGLELDYNHKKIRDLGFGELFALAHVWKELEEQLDERIRKFESIAENNEQLLDKLKKKVSANIVVDEL